MNLQAFADQTAQKFQQAFGRAPRWIAAAPGRVNLIGEHTDYNDGFVLPMGIERYTVLAAAPNDSRTIQLQSASNRGKATIDLEEPIVPSEPSWANYVRGVLDGFIKRGQSIPGFDALIDSNVPIGGGLSSSAALEVATATLLEEATGLTLEPVDKALLAQKAEQDFAGVPCGIMDQFTSTMAREGHLLLLDCRSRTTELVPLADPSISILITNTNVKHELTGGEYGERRAPCAKAAGLLGAPSLRSPSLTGLEAMRSRMEETNFGGATH